METLKAFKPIPVLALRNLVLFPGTTVPIRVGRPQSLAALRAVKSESPDGNGQIIAVLQKPPEQKDHIYPDEIHRVGVLCQIEKSRGSEKEGYMLFVRALKRVEVRNPHEDAGVMRATAVDFGDEIDVDAGTQATLLESIKVLAKQILEYLPAGKDQMITLVDGITDVSFLLNLVAANIEMPIERRQELLETASLRKRSEILIEVMQHVRDEVQVRSEIREKMTTKLGRNQREAILREQMRAIQEELGEGSDGGPGSRSDDYRKKIEDSGMPEAVKKVALDELKRLESIGQQSPETHVIRNYLDLLVAMPWKSEPEEPIDLSKARDILNADHYGLDKIKSRIIEHLATMKLKEGSRGLILLFNGPPGVGKTSLGQSIAKAIGRKFVRVSLGGVRDDAEIRGHRRTYIGAMPGRIIQGIKRVGVNNPVFLLDEIDKLGRGYQGDPSAALLEVLDPEQNGTFTDHYMDVAYDLSKVLFIATANSLESIPGPLLDRMEVVELSSYTTEEKLHIAKNHLLAKQLSEHGIKPEQFTITDAAVQHLITHYTREAGVRELQRRIAALARASTVKLVEGQSQVVLDVKDVDDILGPIRFEHEETKKAAPPGVATGLAWTPVGGEILFIESALMPGNGKLMLTGQLGEVMKESAQIALSVIRSRIPQIAKRLDFEKKDLHVHVPAGAIPKDGPSAGIAMLTSIASLFSGKPVDAKLAMTGEVTLRGAVTPVGGVKEKVMAAHRAGVTRIILCKKNERDLKDVPKEVKDKLQFYFVEDVAEVLRIALGIEIPALDLNTGTWGADIDDLPGSSRPVSVA